MAATVREVQNLATTVIGLQGKPISTTPPVAGQLLTFDGTRWVPAAPIALGDITAVLAGNGLQGGGSEGSVTLSLAAPVTLANGGTGANSGNSGLDNLSGATGSLAGYLSRDGLGQWTISSAPTGPTGPQGPAGPTGPAGTTPQFIQSDNQADALAASAADPQNIYYWV